MRRIIYRVTAYKPNCTYTKCSHDLNKALEQFDKWAGGSWHLVRLIEERQEISDETGQIFVIGSAYLYVSNEQDLDLPSEVRPILRNRQVRV